MKAFQTSLTVANPSQIVLNDVPFAQGQRVEVVIFPKKKVDGKAWSQLQELFKTTQNLSQVQKLTDEEIAAELAAYRNGQ